MKISVIVPVWGAQNVLERCVNSILAQTHQDLELILVEDGSPDESGRLCDELALRDERIRVFHQRNAGTSAARNAGLEAASGDYVCFVDNDDFIHPLELEFLLNLCLSQQVDMALCGFEEAAMNKPLPAAFPPLQNLSCEKIDPWQYIERLCTPLQVQYVVPWAKLYAKKLFNGLRFPVNTLNEDDCIIHTLALRAGSIAVCYQPLHYYCTNPESISRKGIPIQPWLRSLPYKLDRMQCLERAGQWSVLYRVQRLLFYDLLLERCRLSSTEKVYRRPVLRYAAQLWGQIRHNPAHSRKEWFCMVRMLLFPGILKHHRHQEYLS